MLWKKFEFCFFSSIVKNVKFLKNSELILKIFCASVADLSKNKFSMFNFFFFFFNFDLMYLHNLKHYFRFLYKFAVYRELSYVCQSFFNKLFFINYKDMYFFNSKNVLKVSWDLNLITYSKNSIYFSSLKQQKILFSYILLAKFKLIYYKVNISRFIGSLIRLVFLHNTVFLFRGKKVTGDVTMINFVLYLRRTYLTNFKCIKNLVWVSLRSNKNFKISYLWSYLSCFKRLNFNNLVLNFFNNLENFNSLKNFLLDYFKSGFYNRSCCVRFSEWFRQLNYLFINRQLTPCLVFNRFEIFLNSFIFFLLYYIIFALNFFNFLYKVFSVLKLRFNYYGLPGLFSIKIMIYKLRPLKKNVLIRQGFWFRDTGTYLKNKYKNFKVWSLWKNYNFFVKKNKEMNFKNYFKYNKVMSNYYLVFFKKLPNIIKNSSVLNLFILLETRLDIILYRLGFSQSLYFLRLQIKIGFFLVNSSVIRFFSYYVLPNNLIRSSTKFLIIFINKFRLFILYKFRNKLNQKFWFQSKTYYLRYVEFDFLKQAFVLIRFPKFGDINFMCNNFVKFTKNRFPLFENTKSKHFLFSKVKYFNLFS